MPTSLWRNPRLFIASSGEAIPIAEALIAKLRDSNDRKREWFEKIEIIKWWNSGEPGDSLLSALINYAKSCDFAAVLLTADDIVMKGNEGPAKTQRRVARDNCIFELGLFTGFLGHKKRAFILTSLRQEDLPSDFRDILHIPIRESESDSQYEKLLKEASEKIKNRIDDLRHSYDRAAQLKLIPKVHLMEFERPQPEGNIDTQQYGVDIIVHSDQPLEKNRDAAKVVQDNMTNEVNYNYFIEANEDSMRTELPSLIRNFATACLKEDNNTQNVDFWHRAMLKSNEARNSVFESLDNLKNHLRIFLLEDTEQVQFCIHNANKDTAVCYLRYSKDHFVEWCTDEDARKMAEKLKVKRRARDIKRVFNGSIGFDLYSDSDPKFKGFKDGLWDATQLMFPRDFHNELRLVCFGNNID